MITINLSKCDKLINLFINIFIFCNVRSDINLDTSSYPFF